MTAARPSPGFPSDPATATMAMAPVGSPDEMSNPLFWVAPAMTGLAGLLTIVSGFTWTPFPNPFHMFMTNRFYAPYPDVRSLLSILIGALAVAVAVLLLRSHDVARRLNWVAAAMLLAVAVLPAEGWLEAQSGFPYTQFGFALAPLTCAGILAIGSVVIDTFVRPTGTTRPASVGEESALLARALGAFALLLAALMTAGIIYRRIQFSYGFVGFLTYVSILVWLAAGVTLLALAPKLKQGTPGARSAVTWVAAGMALWMVISDGGFATSFLFAERSFGDLYGPLLGILLAAIGLIVMLNGSAARQHFYRTPIAPNPVPAGMPYGAQAMPHQAAYGAQVPVMPYQPVYGGQVPVMPYGGQPPGQQGTNGMAIASFVLGLLGVSVLGITFGFIARGQIRRSGGWERGSGLALAGIILGFVWLAISIAFTVVVLVLAHQCQYGQC
jgi:hypothetical protein